MPRRTRRLRAHVEDQPYALTRGHGSDEASNVDDRRHRLGHPGRALPQRRRRLGTAQRRRTSSPRPSPGPSMRSRARSATCSPAPSTTATSSPRTRSCATNSGKAELKANETWAENRQLQQLSTQLDVPFVGSLPTVAAQVTALSPTNFAATVDISKGRDNGVMVGMPVVANGGLVGIVIQTTPHGATVRLITDVKSLIGVTFGSGKTSIVVSGQGVNNGLGATAVPLTSSVRAGTVLETNGLDGGLYPPGLPGRQGLEGDAHARRGDLQPLAAPAGQPARPRLPRRRAVGALDVTRALIPVTVVTMFIVGVQLSVFSTLAVRRRRLHARVALALRARPRGLHDAGASGRRSWAASSSTRTPPRPSASPRWWASCSPTARRASARKASATSTPRPGGSRRSSRPARASRRRSSTPLGGIGVLNFSLWHGSLVNSMVVNAVAFFVLARPVSRLARRVGRVGVRAYR